MASTYLTPTAVTRESLRVLHQKLNFIGNINRDYDDRYAVDGAKIGSDLKLRLPNRYTVRTTKTLNVQDVTETSVTMSVTNQYGVDMSFSSADLTLSIDDFSKRFISPAMAVLAAKIESDVLASVYKDVYQQVNNIDSAATFAGAITVRKRLVDALTPQDDLTMCFGTQENVDMVDALKGLFQDSKEIASQYRDGMLGRTGGFSFYENTLLPTHTTGTAAAEITINGANQTGAAITVTNGSSKTLKAGDIVTLAGCNRVHPETKVDTGVLQTFVVTADVATSGTSIAISPSVIITGATQNVTAAPTTTGAVTKQGAASAVCNIGMGFHRDAFAFATADLMMPKGVDWSARQVMDGVSMRIVRAYDINNDLLPCRLDVLFGYKTIRPEMACRWANN